MRRSLKLYVGRSDGGGFNMTHQIGELAPGWVLWSQLRDHGLLSLDVMDIGFYDELVSVNIDLYARLAGYTVDGALSLGWWFDGHV